jgi:hypothetical protein
MFSRNQNRTVSLGQRNNPLVHASTDEDATFPSKIAFLDSDLIAFCVVQHVQLEYGAI